jgi:Tol biopolymer transport system component
MPIRGTYTFGESCLDVAKRQLLRAGKVQEISPHAFDLLLYFVQHNGRVITKQEMAEAVWGMPAVSETAIYFQMSHLKHLVPEHLHNIKGKGYLFDADVQWTAETKFETAYLTARPVTGAAGIESFPALSPDGNHVAFSWHGEDGVRFNLYDQNLSTGQLSRITQDDRDDISCSWSADGRLIAFLGRIAGRAYVYVFSVATRRTDTLAEVHGRSGIELIGRHLDWAPDGQSLAVVEKDSHREPFSIYRLFKNGKKSKLTSPPYGSVGDSDPAFSPDGRYLAFVRTHQVSIKDIYILDLTTNTARTLTTEPAYVSGVTWTADSTAIVFSANFLGAFRLWRLAISGGTPQPLLGAGENAMYPHSCRSGRLTYARVFFVTSLWRLCLTDLDHGPQKFISSAGHNVEAQYSPDGQQIAFASDRSGSFEIWASDSKGHNAVQLTSFQSGIGGAGCPWWAPDSRHIVFDCRAEGSANIYSVDLEDLRTRRITTGDAEDVVPSWSDSGIYFASNRGGDWQIWKTDPDQPRLTQLTHKGGFCPVESLDRKYLYYAKGRNVAGIWRLRLGSSQETAFLEHPIAGFWGYWSLVKNGIYFLDFGRDISSPSVVHSVAVRFADFSKGSVSQLATIPELRTVFYQGLTVSPDRRYILYPQLDQGNSNIMIVDNFV